MVSLKEVLSTADQMLRDATEAKELDSKDMEKKLYKIAGEGRYQEITEQLSTYGKNSQEAREKLRELTDTFPPDSLN